MAPQAPPNHRIVPLVVAVPLFLQTLDSSVMSTTLPAIAESLQVQVLHLNLAITAYLLSLAVFLPLSGWLADRHGPRRVFCAAILVFCVGSALCGASQSLGQLVACRVLQGLGGAMMVPVGRLIMLRSVPQAHLVAAMVWFTVPPVIGRMVGPLFGGAIVTFVSWRWIFFVTIPFALAGIAAALHFIAPDPRPTPQQRHQPFDVPGFALLALGLTGVMGAVETGGKALVPAWASWAIGAAGALALAGYWAHSRRRAEPLIDLTIVRFPTYRASVIGAIPLRLAIGALPFLLPLLMQLGFGLTPLQAGTLTTATAVGAMGTRTVVQRAIRTFGFRSLMIGTTLITGAVYTSYALFTAQTPHWLIFTMLVLGGLFNSMAMVAMSTLGYSEIPPHRMSHASTMTTMAQQLSVTLGVVMAAATVTVTTLLHGRDSAHPTAADFTPALVMVGLVTLISALAFRRLTDQHGAELRGVGRAP